MCMHSSLFTGSAAFISHHRSVSYAQPFQFCRGKKVLRNAEKGGLDLILLSIQLKQSTQEEALVSQACTVSSSLGCAALAEPSFSGRPAVHMCVWQSGVLCLKMSTGVAHHGK